MALCYSTVTVYVHSTSSPTSALVASSVLIPNVDHPTTCTGSVALSSTEYREFLDQQTNFGWSAEAFDLAYQGGLMVFAIGLGIGLIISQLRKTRL